MNAKHITIEVDHGDPQTLLWILLPDSITMDTYEQTEREIAAAVAHRTGSLVVDLRDTRVMFSSGFGLLVALSKKATQCGLAMYVVNPSQSVYEGFVTVGLVRVLNVLRVGESLDFLKKAF